MQKFKLEINDELIEIQLEKAFCIGYSGRDKEKTYEHIKELSEIGIPEPEEVPMLYPVSVNNVTQEKFIEVVGKETSGEAEIVLIFGDTKDEVYITLGSDHTDRDLETVSINKSKQVCAKPLATKAWNLNEVLDHWDQLILSSELNLNGEWVPYQKDNLTAILPYNEIIKYIEKKKGPRNNSIYFSGTVPLLEGFSYGGAFRMSLEDPLKKDIINSTYKILNIEVR